MHLNSAMSIMSGAEFLLWSALGYFFWSKKLHKRFPAMNVYLAIKVISTPVELVLLYVQSQPWGRGYYPAYFFTSWAIYIVSAITLLFVCLEIFRTALSPFSGLIRFGTVIFRWAAIVSVLSSLASISFANRGILIIPDLAAGLMRSVSIVELCLLAFLCLAMNALQLSPRDLTFGLALGFGVMSSNDFVLSSLIQRYTSLNAPLQFVYESIVLFAIATWTAYAALPEPARKPIVVAANSTIYRWNEIASALGHKGTNVVVPQTASSFFLTDVEKVVEKVLTRNYRGSESES